jgi:hypothetical protein
MLEMGITLFHKTFGLEFEFDLGDGFKISEKVG